MTIHVLPGIGLADGGHLFHAPLNVISADARLPNTNVWVHFSRAMEILEVWRREERDESSGK